MGQIHFEVYVRKGAGAGWVLEFATEDRARAIETAEELLAEKRIAAFKITKETQDEETLEFKTVTILTKGDTGPAKKAVDADAQSPLCVSPQELYSLHAREQISRLLEGWLAREKVTAFELLHRPDLIEKLDAAGMDLQHAIQKIAVPEAQARGIVVHEVIRHYQGLIQSAIERVLADARRKAFPNLVHERFAAATERVAGDGERSYLLGGAIAQHIAGAKSWGDKVNALLDLADAAPQNPGLRAFAFQVIETPLAEILRSQTGLSELLGPGLDLGGGLAAMTRIAAADTVETLSSIEPIVARMIPPIVGPAARLANWLEGGKFEAVRIALGQRVLRELANPRRLRPADPEGEIALLRALAMALTAAAGNLLPLEQVQQAFTERSKMLVRGDFVETYLGKDRSPIGEVAALIALAENVTGAANKRAASRFVGANVGSLRFERDTRASPDSPATKLAQLAALQRDVARVGFIPEELAPIQAKIGEIGGLVEADAKLVAALMRAQAPAAHRLTLLLKLASGDSCPLGPAADRAKVEALKMAKDAGVRSELAQNPQALQNVRGLLQGIAA